MNREYNRAYYEKASEEEREFLDNYSPGNYEKPSVTADIVVFTVDPVANRLCVVLIRRKEFPYKRCWALPGGFLQANTESVEQTAARELKEETGLNNVFLQQLKTYSLPDRDPRMHVISVAHFALVPYSQIKLYAGDDAESVGLFQIVKVRKSAFGLYDPGYVFVMEQELDDPLLLEESSFAFDHYQIVSDAIERVYGRRDYCFDLFNLLENDQSFTISEFQKIYSAVSFRETDNANFRKMFINRYVKTGFCVSLNLKTDDAHPAELYRVVGLDGRN